MEEQSALEVAKQVPLTPEAKGLLRSDQSWETFLQVLVDHQRHVDAVRWLAHGLPPRDGLWWACLCVRHTVEDVIVERRALYSSARLVQDPSDANKNACRQWAKAATLETPAGCLALAASNLDRDGYPPSRSIGAAVLLAASRTPSMNHALHQYGAIGLEVRAGKLPWNQE